MVNEQGSLIISSGMYLQDNEFISKLDLQKIFSENFGYNPPLSNCQELLEILCLSKYLEEVGSGIYTFKHKTIIKQTIIPPPHYGANPLYFPG